MDRKVAHKCIQKKKRMANGIGMRSNLWPADQSNPRYKRLAERKARIEQSAKRQTPKIKSPEINYECPSYRTLPRLLFAVIKEKNAARVRELIEDPRMPVDALTTQYSYHDDRTPIVEAFATGDETFIMAVLQAKAERMRKAEAGDDLLPDSEPIHKYCMNGYFSLLSLEDHAQFKERRIRDLALSALENYAPPTELKESLLTQLVRRNVSFSIINDFRPVSSYLQSRTRAVQADVSDIIKTAHNVYSMRGEFYGSCEYGRAAIEALRYGHCKLALDLVKFSKFFPELTTQILADEHPKHFITDQAHKTSLVGPFITSVHAAAAASNLPALDWYTRAYKDAISMADHEHWMVIHYAAASAKPDALRWAIRQRASITAKTKDGQTALHVAIRAGRVENVKVLLETMEKIETLISSQNLPLEERSIVNWKDAMRMSPLLLAAHTGNVEIVELLLKYPFIQKEISDAEGRTAEQVAASRDNLDALEVIGKTPMTFHDRDALMWAAINGHGNIAAYLLISGIADPTATDRASNSAMHYACAYGWTEVAQVIAIHNEDTLKTANKLGETPAVAAFRKGHYGLIAWLMQVRPEYVGKDPTTKANIKAIVTKWMKTHSYKL